MLPTHLLWVEFFLGPKCTKSSLFSSEPNDWWWDKIKLKDLPTVECHRIKTLFRHDSTATRFLGLYATHSNEETSKITNAWYNEMGIHNYQTWMIYTEEVAHWSNVHLINMAIRVGHMVFGKPDTMGVELCFSNVACDYENTQKAQQEWCAMLTDDIKWELPLEVHKDDKKKEATEVTKVTEETKATTDLPVLSDKQKSKPASKQKSCGEKKKRKTMGRTAGSTGSKTKARSTSSKTRTSKKKKKRKTK
jgi:hypothetical protein